MASLKFYLLPADQCAKALELHALAKEYALSAKLECDWKSLQDSLEAAEGRQFVRLMGSMTQQEVPILARLVNKIWQQGDSLAVRVDVQLDAAYSTGPVQRGDSNTLAARITSALQSGNDQEVYRLWNKLSEAS